MIGFTEKVVAYARGFDQVGFLGSGANYDAALRNLALIGSAAADFITGASLLVIDPKTAIAAAEAKLTRALSSVPGHARGHMLLGLVEMTTKRASQGVARCEHALTLDRNLATAHAYIGLGKIYIGRAEETEAHIAEALRLSPRDTLALTWMHIAAVAKNNLRLSEQAAP